MGNAWNWVRRATSAAKWVATLAMVAAACSEAASTPSAPATLADAGSDAGAPADESDAAPAVTVPPPSYPIVLANSGTVIAHPVVQPILFKGDPLEHDLDTYFARLGTSTYFADAAKEYGVGALTIRPTIVVDEEAPAHEFQSGVEAWILQKLAGVSPPFGVPDPSVIYLVVYPENTVIQYDPPKPAQSCGDFGGFHGSVSVRHGDAGAQSVGYAVVPRCSYGGSSFLDETTSTIAHELFEWATDPFVTESSLGYVFVDDDHLAWGDAAEFTELSDMCSVYDRQPALVPSDLGYVVQRHWSNARAKAGLFPCAPAGPMFMAYPEEPDVYTTNVGDFATGEYRKAKTKSIRVARGTSRTVNVAMYADDPAAAGTWKVEAAMFPRTDPPGAPSAYTLRLNDGDAGDSASGGYGGTVTLTITAAKNASTELAWLASRKDDQLYFYPFRIVSIGGN